MVIRTAFAIVGLVVMAVGSKWLLRQEFGASTSFAIQPSGVAIQGFAVGVLSAIGLIGIIGVLFWIAVPYHFERGALSLRQTFPELQNFALSNIGEELVFRGYLLLALMRRFGLRTALFVVSIIFGLFHLPGLSGMAALKMVITTGACSYLFAAAFLRTGTIWGAIALHFFANVLLHKVTGLSGGAALLKPVLHSAYPQSYDPGFWIFTLVPLLLAIGWFRIGGKSGEAPFVRKTALTA